ncbi:MAG: hypothetical protein ACRCVJ_05150 [Clostridium sp.]|uniref:hypothetical protein n=1 Tax=Clostridium sp. TaxID=1506 RepID=UPI003F34FB63
MLTIEKDIFLNSNFNVLNSPIEINLSALSINETDTTYTREHIDPPNYKINYNDIILVNLSITNRSNISIENLQLKINDDNVFKFIQSSLINKKTKGVFIPENTCSNLFSLGFLHSNEKLTIQFYVTTNLNNLNHFQFNNPINFLTLNSHAICDESSESIIETNQSVLTINSKTSCGLIEIENIGTAPSKNITYRYEIPKGYLVDPDSISYILNGINCNISSKILNNNILFKIDNIPESNSNSNKKIIISLKHKKSSNTLFSAKIDIK